MNTPQICLALTLALGLAVSARAAGPNLVTNPGFETGDFTGYTVVNGGGPTITLVSADSPFMYGDPRTGSFFLAGGQPTGLALVSQTVNTIAGAHYNFSLYLASDGTNPDEFQARINGVTVTDQTNIPAQAYTLNSFNFTATGPTALTLGLNDVNSWLDVDDLSVNLLFTTFGATPGLTPNQQSIANYIDQQSATANGTNFFNLITALGGLSASALPGAFDQLSPQAFGQFTSETAFNNASFETEAMDNYLASQRDQNGNFLAGNGQLDSSGLTMNDPSYASGLASVHSRLMAWNPAPFDGTISDVANPLLGGVDMKDSKDMKSMQQAPAYTDPWSFFVRGNVILAQGFSDSDVSHFDDNTESVVLGTDYRITPNFLVGLTAGYGHTDVTLDNNGSSATVDSYSPGFYASYADKGWYTNLTGNYTHDAFTQDRVIGFLGQTAHSAPEGNQGTANLDGGYDFHHGGWTFGPTAGLQYTHLTVDGYDESGSIADLTVNDQQSDSLRSRVGGRVSFSYSHYGMVFTPHLDASWQHEFMDQSRGITSQFDAAGLGSFAVRTTNPSRDSALADIGVDVEFNRTITGFAEYEVQAGQENYFGQSVQGGVKVGF